MNGIKQKIVITGAPSSGKSTTMTELARVLGKQVVLVPESARVLLSGGFPAPAHDDLEQIRAFQKAIIPLQRGLETVFMRQHPEAEVMIFDRGALDGAGFWPKGPEDFIAEFTLDTYQELRHYHTVLFFELPTPEAFGGINRLRFHDYQQSLESEKRLKQIWGAHPNFIEIKATTVFEDKIKAAVLAVKSIVNALA